MNDSQVYCVATDKTGAAIKKPRPGVQIEETQYYVLATSVKQAVEIVEESNAATQADETVTKAWLVTHITGGLSGSKFKIEPRQPAPA